MDMIPALVQSQSPVKKGLGKDGSSGQSAVEKERETIMLAKSTVCWPRVHVGGEPVVPQGPKQLPLLAGAADDSPHFTVGKEGICLRIQII